MLDQGELRRRVRAARVLADISQAKMNEAGHSLGLRKHELGAVERGDLEVRQVHLPMLCEVLKVPMSWFTETREVIVAQRAADYVEAFTELLRLVTLNGDLMNEVETALQAVLDEAAKRRTETPATAQGSRAARR